MRLSILVNLRYHTFPKLVWFKNYDDLKKNHILTQNLTLIAIGERRHFSQITDLLSTGLTYHPLRQL